MVARRLSRFAIARGYWYPPRPTCFEDLTVTERLFLSRGNVMMQIIKLEARWIGAAQKGIIGNAIALPQDAIGALNLILPRSVDEVKKLLFVCFV